MDWGAVKSGAALFKFLGAVGKKTGNQGMAGMGLFGDLLGGDAGGVVSDISEMGAFGPVGVGSPQDASTLTPAGVSSAGQSLPAGSIGHGEGVTHNDNRSTNFYGDIHDSDQKQQAEKVKADRAKSQLQPVARGPG
jgi:hypothetical protein